jgi:hypothetical protein
MQIGAQDGSAQGVALVSGYSTIYLSDLEVGDAVTAAIRLKDNAGSVRTYYYTEWLYAD